MIKEDLMKEIEKIAKEPKIKICPVCKKELPKDVHVARKFHKGECQRTALRAHHRMANKNTLKREQVILRMQIRNNYENPSCIFQAGQKCVKKAIQFKDFKIYPRNSRCPICPRDKCPNFKPLHSEIYEAVQKLKKIEKEKNETNINTLDKQKI